MQRSWFWDVDADRHHVIDATHNGRHYDALSPNGRWLAFLEPAGTAQTRAVVVDTTTGSVHVEWTYPGDGQALWLRSAAAFSPDDVLAVTGVEGGNPVIRVYDVPARRLMHTVPDAAGIEGFSADGRLLFAGWAQLRTPPTGNVTIAWDIQRGECVAAVPYDKDARVVAYDGRFYDALNIDGQPYRPIIRCREADTGREVWSVKWPDGWRLDLAGRVGVFAECDDRATVVRRRLPDGAVLDRTPLEVSHFGGAGFTPNLRWAVGSHDDSHRYDWLPSWARQRLFPKLEANYCVRLVDLATGDVSDICTGVFASARFFPDGRRFWTRDSEGRCAVWDVPPRKPLGWFAAGAAAWAAPLALVARWRVRRIASRAAA